MTQQMRADLDLMWKLRDHMVMRHTEYGWGMKAPSLSCDSALIKRIDCSGLVRWAVNRIFHGTVVLPDGSVNQHDWCRVRLESAGDYASAVRAVKPGRLLIAFLSPDPVGHVWLVGHDPLVSKVETFESWGHHGPGSRDPLTSVLLRNCSGVYYLQK